MSERFLSSEELSQKLPFSINNTPKPIFAELPLKENSSKTIRFDPEQKKLLEKNGYQILTLAGASIADLRSVNFIKTDILPQAIENSRALPTEVAFNLKTGFKNIGKYDNFSLSALPSSSFFLPDKKLKSGRREIQGLNTIVPNLATYSELAYRYYQSTGLPLWTGSNTHRTGYLITRSGPESRQNYCVGGQPSRDTRLSIYSFSESKDIVNRLLLVAPSEIFRL